MWNSGYREIEEEGKAESEMGLRGKREGVKIYRETKRKMGGAFIGVLGIIVLVVVYDLIFKTSQP